MHIHDTQKGGTKILTDCDHTFIVDRYLICQDDRDAIVCSKCGLPEELT